MKRFPLLRRQSIFSKKNIIYVVLFGVLTLHQSCSPESGLIEGSFDVANEEEGGPSALKNSSEVGYNVTLEMLWGFQGISGPIHSPHSNSPENGPIFMEDNYRFTAPPSGSFAFGGGLQFIQKGSKIDGASTRLHYLELLGDVLYRAPMASGGTLFGGLGPYIGYGIGGNVSGNGFKESAFGGQDGYKRFDAGLHLTAGYQLPSSLTFDLGYEYGLLNKSPAPDFTSRNRALSFNVGYSLTKIIGAFRKK